MHDNSELELKGIPAVCISTVEFADAAAVQGKAYGFQPTCVFLPHPIQDRTDAEMVAIADEFVDRVVDGLIKA